MALIDDLILRAGSVADLARLLGEPNPQTINNWKRRGIPKGKCARIESAFDGIRCEHIYPDVQWQRDADGRVTGYCIDLTESDT
jgi:DNA-binding transcriptional regulator YdaS (Cro superfamily)